MDQQKSQRRRGTVLEEAILEAAWAELATGGYSTFTYEAVAKGAGTSRAVLYRRWPTRAGLAAAAIARHVRHNPLVVADLGNLRDELCLLMRKFADRSPPHLLRLIFDMSDDMAMENASFADAQFQENPLEAILARAMQRGDLDPHRISPRVMRVPLSLVFHEIIVTAKPISDATISDIVDQVVLPLITPAPNASGKVDVSTQ